MSSSGPIVICGGGIIGASVAYHLAQLGRAKDVTVVEATGVACAASGFAGGFLARSWCSGTATDELARVSFDMVMCCLLRIVSPVAGPLVLMPTLPYPPFIHPV